MSDKKLSWLKLALCAAYILLCGAAASYSVSQAAEVTLEWDPYVDDAAVGIHVYFEEFDTAKSACQTLSRTRDTDAPLPKETVIHTVVGLDDTKSYCLFIRGVAADGAESDASNHALYFMPKFDVTVPSNVLIIP